MQSIPKDPAILLSYINTKLRDYYSGLDVLCSDLGIKAADICRTLNQIGYRYNPETNQFQ